MRFQRALAVGIAVLAAAAPLLIGSVHPVTQVALSAATFVLCIVYVVDRRGRGFHSIPFLLPALIALLATAAQLIPLPASIVREISPSAVDLRWSVAPVAQLPLTLDVSATTIELAKAFACCGLLVLATSVSRSRTLARQLAAVLAMIAATVAVILFIQRAIGTKTILGIYTPRGVPANGVAGTFVDGNHAASIFALGALTALGLARDAVGGVRTAMLSAAALSAAALLSTGSRSGAVGLGVGAVVFAAVMLSKRLGRSTGIVMSLLLVGAIAAGALQVADGLRSRIEQAGVEGSVANQKTHGWRDTVRMTEDFRWTGAGRGAFEGAVLKYRQDDEGVRLVYAESLPLQAGADWGLPIAALLALLILWDVRQLASRLRHFDDIALGAGCGVLAVLLHEFADFGLEFPGVAYPTAIALGLVLGRLVEKDREHWTRFRVSPAWGVVALAVWAVAIPAAALAVPHTVDADWENCRRLLQSGSTKKATAEIDASIVRHPAIDYFELLRAQVDGGDAFKHANRALYLHPANALAHSVVAHLLLRRGYRAQAALELRFAGTPITNRLMQLLGDDVVDAVPQTQEALFQMARRVAADGKPKLVERAITRGIDAAKSPDEALLDGVRLADELKQAPLASTLADQLLDARPDPAALAVAAKALSHSGHRSEAIAAIDDGLKRYPGTPLLILSAARLRFESGDLNGARAILLKPTDISFTLAERKAAEELVAQIEDRRGDVVGATAARARARMIGSKLPATRTQ
jgi:hypothetical protein